MIVELVIFNINAVNEYLICDHFVQESFGFIHWNDDGIIKTYAASGLHQQKSVFILVFF